MKGTTISLCALLVLVLAVGDAWAQGKGQGGGKAGGGAGRSASEREAGGQSRPAARRPDTRRQRPPAVEEAEKAAKEVERAAEKRPVQQTPQPSRRPVKDAPAAKKNVQDVVGGARGKDHQQQIRALDKQLQHGHAKHLRRVARLARIRALAAEKGDVEMLARIDKLTVREREVYGRKVLQMQEQRRAMTQSGEAVVGAGPGDPGKAKVEARPAREKAGGDIDPDDEAKRIKDKVAPGGAVRPGRQTRRPGGSVPTDAASGAPKEPNQP